MSPRQGSPRSPAGSREDRAERTKAALVSTARRLFVEQGYFATGTEQIVTESGVGTRGALYHHFVNKQALFRAVFEAVQRDLAGGQRERLGLGAMERLRHGLQGFLDASLRPEVQRIVLIDGPAVLGWEVWREIEAEFGLGAIEAMLQAAVDEGTIERRPSAVVLAHLLLAAVDEAALFIANADDPRAARVDAGTAIDRLLAGLRNDSR